MTVYNAKAWAKYLEAKNAKKRIVSKTEMTPIVIMTRAFFSHCVGVEEKILCTSKNQMLCLRKKKFIWLYAYLWT